MTAREDWQGTHRRGLGGANGGGPIAASAALTERLLAAQPRIQLSATRSTSAAAPASCRWRWPAGVRSPRRRRRCLPAAGRHCALAWREHMPTSSSSSADAAQWHPADDFTPATADLAPRGHVLRRSACGLRQPGQLRRRRRRAAVLVLSRARARTLSSPRSARSCPLPPKPADPYAPGPFAFAERDHVSADPQRWRVGAASPSSRSTSPWSPAPARIRSRMRWATSSGSVRPLRPCASWTGGSRRDALAACARSAAETLPRRHRRVARGDLDRHGPACLRNSGRRPRPLSSHARCRPCR